MRLAGAWTWEELLCGILSWGGCSAGGLAGAAFAHAQLDAAASGARVLQARRDAAAGGGAGGAAGAPTLSAAAVLAMGDAAKEALAMELAKMLQEEGVERAERTVGGKVRLAGAWTWQELLCGIISWGSRSAGGKKGSSLAEAQRAASARGALLQMQREEMQGDVGDSADDPGSVKHVEHITAVVAIIEAAGAPLDSFCEKVAAVLRCEGVLRFEAQGELITESSWEAAQIYKGLQSNVGNWRKMIQRHEQAASASDLFG